MFSHLFVGITDFDRALAFYRPLMAVLQITERFCEPQRPWAGWQSAPGRRPYFVIARPFDGQPHEPGNGQMVAFMAASRAQVERAHACALAHGGRCEGPPGLRPHYHPDYFGAYVRDPDGNKLCVACHDGAPVPAAAPHAHGALPAGVDGPAARGDAAPASVRPLTADDLAAYRALMLQAYAQAPDAFTSTPEERAAQPESWWRRRVHDPAGLTLALGAFRGEALVGTVALEYAARAKLRHKGHLIGLYVPPGERRAGVGRALVQAAIVQAAARPGVAVLTLTVTQGNAAAQVLYRGCGFQAFGVEPMAVAGPDGWRAKVHLWRALPAAGVPLAWPPGGR